jgi:predicted nucleic-acid-binding Zn-ribbon protein
MKTCPKCGNDDPDQIKIHTVNSELRRPDGRGPAWAAIVAYECMKCGYKEKSQRP